MMTAKEVFFVSVVIPTYNRRELLVDTIESLINQSYPRDLYEIIIVDNSSTDGTAETVRSLQTKASDILRYFCKENEGPGSARNFGISKVRGVIVAFTDSDCVADQNWLKNGASKMTEGVGIVQGKTLPHPDQPQSTLQQTMEVLSEDGYYQTCNIFYRKESLDSSGGFSPAFCGLSLFGKPRWGGEDTDLAWNVKKQGWNSVFADDAVVYHHIFPITSLKTFISSMHLNIIFTLARIIKKHPEIRDTKLYRRVFKSQQRAFFYILILSMFPGVFIHWGFFLLGLPYLTQVLKVSFHNRSILSYHRGLALLGLITLIELVESTLSLCASFIYRTVIL